MISTFFYSTQFFCMGYDIYRISPNITRALYTFLHPAHAACAVSLSARYRRSCLHVCIMLHNKKYCLSIFCCLDLALFMLLFILSKKDGRTEPKILHHWTELYYWRVWPSSMAYIDNIMHFKTQSINFINKCIWFSLIFNTNIRNLCQLAFNN